MSNLIIGNIIALIASLLMVYSGIIKKKQYILKIQAMQIGLSVISNLILGGITGAIINAISCIRNILCYKGKLAAIPKVLLIISTIITSLLFNNLGVIGLLPVVSSITYILLMNIKDVIKFKLLIIFTMIMWLIYDLYIKSYTSAIFDFLNIIANFVSIYQLTKLNKQVKIS